MDGEDLIIGSYGRTQRCDQIYVVGSVKWTAEIMLEWVIGRRKIEVKEGRWIMRWAIRRWSHAKVARVITTAETYEMSGFRGRAVLLHCLWCCGGNRTSGCDAIEWRRVVDAMAGKPLSPRTNGCAGLRSGECDYRRITKREDRTAGAQCMHRLDEWQMRAVPRYNNFFLICARVIWLKG